MNLFSERLALRQLQESDWPLFLDIETDKEIQKHIADISEVNTLRKRFDGQLGQWDKEKEKWTTLVIESKDENKAIGFIGIYSEWEEIKHAEVGIKLLAASQGRGYGKEALTLVLDFLINQCRYHKIKAVITEGNEASCKLFRSCGFLLEGTLRDNCVINGSFHNDLIYGLLASEFSE